MEKHLKNWYVEAEKVFGHFPGQRSGAREDQMGSIQAQAGANFFKD